MFGTPHRVDLAALCRGRRRAAHAAPPGRHPAAWAAAAGLRLVEVRADRARLRAGHAELRAAVSRGRRLDRLEARVQSLWEVTRIRP